MSLRPLIQEGNFSRDSDDHLWAGNVSEAIGVFGTSRDQYSGIRTIVYGTSGIPALVLRYNQETNGSRQYYQFRVSPTFAVIEEVNVSTVYTAPTILHSRTLTTAVNTSIRLAFDVVPVNDSQDRLRGFYNDMQIVDYVGALNLSAGKQGLLVQSGIYRFDRNTVVGAELDHYCSPQDVTNLLKGIGITTITDEGEMIAMIAKASEEINRRTHTVFGRLEKITERHEGIGAPSVLVNHVPIQILSKIDVYNYNNALVDSLDESSDSLIVERETGEITLPAKSVTLTPIYGVGLHPVVGAQDLVYREYDYSQYFGVGRRNIVVSYLYGFDDIPHEIWDACRKLVGIQALVKLGNYNTKGAAMIRLGDAMEDYRVRGSPDSGSLPFIGTILKWEKDIDKDLEPYSVLIAESV